MKGNCGNWQPEFAEERQHLPDDGLNIVLSACDDEGRDLVLQQVPLVQCFLVLYAVHALDHLRIQAAGRTPADGRGHEDHVGPVHHAFVHLIHLVAAVHLCDGTRPGAGARGLGVETLRTRGP